MIGHISRLQHSIDERSKIIRSKNTGSYCIPLRGTCENKIIWNYATTPLTTAWLFLLVFAIVARRAPNEPNNISNIAYCNTKDNYVF